MKKVAFIVTGIFFVMSLMVTSSWGDVSYDIDFIQEVVRKADAHTDTDPSENCWIKNLSIDEKFLSEEIAPGVRMEEVLVPWCVLYETADILTPKSEQDSPDFTKWMNNLELQKAWAWVLANRELYKVNYEIAQVFNEQMKKLQDEIGKQKFVNDAVSMLNLIKGNLETGKGPFEDYAIEEMLKTGKGLLIDYAIKEMLTWTAGMSNEVMQKEISTLLSIYGILTGPTPIGLALFVSNFDGLRDDIEFVYDAKTGRIELRHMYLLYYLLDELNEDNEVYWKQTNNEPTSNWYISSDNSLLRMPVPEAAMFVAGRDNDNGPPKLYNLFLNELDWSQEASGVDIDGSYVELPYTGGCYYNESDIDRFDDSKYFETLKNLIYKSEPLTPKDDFYESWTDLLLNSSKYEHIQNVKGWLLNLSTIFRFYKSLEEDVLNSYMPGFEQAMDRVFVEFKRNYDTAHDGPYFRDVDGKWNSYLEAMKKYFAQKIATALRGEYASGSASYTDIIDTPSIISPSSMLGIASDIIKGCANSSKYHIG